MRHADAQIVPGSIHDLGASNYKGFLRFMFGFDRGGGVVRFTLELSGSATHLIGCYEGAEIATNVQSFLAATTSWPDQFSKILEEGIHDPVEAKISPVQLVAIGDKAALSEAMGHQGSSSTYPILFDKTPSTHLRKAHRDGSPHSPDIEGCKFELRSLADFDNDYLENKMDRRNRSNMRLNGKYHNSIIAQRLLNLRSMDDLAVSTLHIWLSLGLILTRWVTLKVRILDGNATNYDVIEMAREFCEQDCQDDIQDQVQSTMEDKDDEEYEEEEERADSDVTDDEVDEEEEDDADLTPEIIQKKICMAEIESQWTFQAQKVAALEEEGRLGEEEIEERQFLKERLVTVLEEPEDEKKLELKVKKRFKGRKVNKAFKRCSRYCFLTKYDVSPSAVECTLCNRAMHIECELYTLSEATGNVFCHECKETDSKQYTEDRLLNFSQVTDEKFENLKKLGAQLNTEKLELQRKESAFKEYIGPLERAFEAILENQIGVSRQEFQSGCWVGGHVEKIIMLSHLISPVLDKLKVDQENFNEICAVLKTLLKITKAKRFLSDEELNTLEDCCNRIGYLYPKTFRPCSITPKIHDLIFHLPRKARYFRTVGGVREDALEASHSQGNSLARRYASVKNKPEKLRLMLQGFEAGIKMKAGELKTPLVTRKKRKRGLHRSLSTDNPRPRPPLFEW